MNENELAKIVFSLGLKVHKALGPGLLESAYEECLFYEIKKASLKVDKQKALPLNSVLFKDGVKRVINGTL